MRSVAPGNALHPADILRCLWTEFRVRTVLHEGGPRLFGPFLKVGLADELFLTIAPQVAGRNGPVARPGFVTDVAFAPENAPWAELQSLRIAGSHLFLRLSFRRHLPVAVRDTVQHSASWWPIPEQSGRDSAIE